ncbi:hypothetical protein TUSST3_68820 [Streptomyces sp. TUS-ST3]|nr:hypothetical protein TUSST3_68820 [Streptomyces sp. TUS-ST3]
MFLWFPPEIRKIASTTNMIQPPQPPLSPGDETPGHSPNVEATLKILYLVIRDRRPKPTGRTYGWTEAINTLAGPNQTREPSTPGLTRKTGHPPARRPSLGHPAERGCIGNSRLTRPEEAERHWGTTP